MLAKDQSLIFRHWFALKAQVKAITALFEVIGTLSIDDEIDDDDASQPRQTGPRV